MSNVKVGDIYATRNDRSLELEITRATKDGCTGSFIPSGIKINLTYKELDTYFKKINYRTTPLYKLLNGE